MSVLESANRGHQTRLSATRSTALVNGSVSFQACEMEDGWYIDSSLRLLPKLKALKLVAQAKKLFTYSRSNSCLDGCKIAELYA